MYSHQALRFDTKHHRRLTPNDPFSGGNAWEIIIPTNSSRGAGVAAWISEIFLYKESRK